MTSLYLSLKGSYAQKLPNKQRDNPLSYPEKQLYLNLLSAPKDSTYEYEFKFLTQNEAKKNDENHHWFLVGKILDLKEKRKIDDYITEKVLSANPDEEKVDFAKEVLDKLHAIIHLNETIIYNLEESTDLEKIFNIFTRINHGGTLLSYSDLLLSFVISQWEEKDARDEINMFVKEINKIGNGFNMTKSMVLRSCLVLCDFSDISFKVDNFNSQNISYIKKEWNNITRAISDALRLVSSFGFSHKNMTSKYLIIPIAYYLKHIGLPKNFESSTQKTIQENRKKIKKWFISSLLKQVFSSHPDSVLKSIRKIIKNNSGEFPLENIAQHFKEKNRALDFTEDEVTQLVRSTKYNDRNALVLLSIVYPWADLSNNFHLDHIFPQSIFKNRKKLIEKGVRADKIDYFWKIHNRIANIQLLEGIPNREKYNTDPAVWIKKTYSDPELSEHYKRKNFIPDVDLSFSNFDCFFEEREKLLIAALEKKLFFFLSSD